MIDIRKLLLGGSATAAIAAASFSAALAQTAAAPAQAADTIETISSSASRLELKGFDQPTPVSVIGLESINRDAKVEIGDEIRELPQIRGGNAINSGSNSRNVAQGDTAIDTLSLRNLGANRNLVLFDRQRIVSSTIQVTQVDLATIPQSVISRVDVVTGGASAAWGSDAVTGVINLVINKNFEGMKGSLSYSNNTEVTHQIYKADAAWGTSFLGGKGHMLMAGTWTVSNDVVFRGQLPNDGRAFVYNSAYCAAGGVTYPVATPTSGGTCASPTGAPLLTYAYDTGSATITGGGLINSNTAGVAGSGLAASTTSSVPNTGLRGTMLVGSPVATAPFSYGTVYNNTICYNGCSNNVNTGLTPWDPIPAAPYHSAVYFNYTSYKITPDITASVQLNYSRLSTRTFGGERSASAVTIFADNPFLPTNVQQAFVCQGGVSAIGAGAAPCVGTLSNGYDPYGQNNRGGTLAQMIARPTQSLVMGLDYLNNATAAGANSSTKSKYTLDNLCQAIGVPCSYANKAMMRGVFTLDGVLSDDWNWTAYIQNGTLRMAQTAPTNAVSARFNNALDAVRVTSGNVGTSGLPIGSITCRGLLNPAVAATTNNVPVAQEITGCIPMNPFGYQNISAGAFNYIEPGANSQGTGILNRNLFIISQTTGAAALNGVMPWHLPAGDIGIATGFEYRLEQAGQYNTDIRTQNTGYGVGNVTPFSNHYHVEEGFLEIDAPLLKNEFVNSLDVSMGGRITSYSTSGLVETWKLGATSQINDDIKLRATFSYDIRAPSIWDLYTPGGPAGITCRGLSGVDAANPCFNVSGGNPNLQPEKASTISAGIVLTPSFIDGLTASVDWYQLHLHGGITSPSMASILSNCRAGIQVFCNQIVFATPGDMTSPITFIYSTRVNAALLTTSGLDFALAYGFDLFTGSADVSFNGNYAYDFLQNLNNQIFQGAGATGGFYSGGPKFQGTVNANYREGAWSFGVQARITGDAVRDLGTEGVTGLTYQSATYTKVNGVDVATVSGGQQGAGITTHNYVAMRVPLDLRASYKWDSSITLFSAVDNIQNLPTDSTLRRAYRVGVRFAY
jgi:outer membrane receptor protein involved in Fe transport